MSLLKKTETTNYQGASLKKDMTYIGFLLFLVIFFAVVNFWFTVVNSRNDKNYIESSGELRILSQTIAKHSGSAIDGVSESFSLLAKSRDDFDEGLNKLKNGEASLNLPSSSPSIRLDELLNLEETWIYFKEQIDTILSRYEFLMFLRSVEVKLEAVEPQIKEKFSKVMDLLSKEGSVDIAIAAKQAILVESLFQDLYKIMHGNSFSKNTTIELTSEIKAFPDALTQMSRNVSVGVKQEIDSILSLYSAIEDDLNKIASSSATFTLVHKAANNIYSGSQRLLDQATILSRAYMLESEQRFVGEPTGYMLGATALLLLVWLGYRIHSDTKEALAITRSQQKSNKTAVWQLLDELANLADGDLTSYATINGEMTGAIAESVNYAIDALRRLVFTINDTAIKVSSSAQEVQTTGRRLAYASENQAGEIVGAAASMNAMAVSIKAVSETVDKSDRVAQESLSISQRGVCVVKDTIRGMDDILGQIQETSKKIKQLGESTQEIGDIVSLINDITEQTNILALNASIQAAMAGEAGKGFSVVAEEVQRLAERSSKATHQIEVLVRAIQEDTKEAVVSMEETTQEVVRGTALAKDAGVALEEIESVSLKLAELLKKISLSAKEQTRAAEQISKTMGVIQEITTQTATGSHVMANSIGNLAALAVELRDSASGFKLPMEQG